MKCKGCDKELSLLQMRKGGVFCSLSCSQRGSRNFFCGKRHSTGTKVKMSQAHKYLVGELNPFYGREHSRETKQKISDALSGTGNPNFGKHLSDEARIQRSKDHQGKKLPTGGDRHWNWQGGISFDPYPSSWTDDLKRAIRKRDGSCQLCGCHNRKLAVHHIDYDKENLDPKNLVTLCVSCHGKTNLNRDYWSQYFRAVVSAKALEA